uniref:Uncharacterized protein n=1 Tax=Nelumbo nucifera TaxID=4432 RepID=A0A822Z433_NELNU|nr:TPA_asm: hypothetical protein HUJ06_006918 [Nelumbo nucifera]
MGNCIDTSWTHDQQRERKERQEDEELKAGGVGKEGHIGKGGLGVKIVLTREELEWLVSQLKEKGGRKLGDILGEIENGRRKAGGWKPSLESIMEGPEVHEMDR